MTMPEIAAPTATAPATGAAADPAVAAPVFAVGLPALTILPDPPQIPDMTTQLPDFIRVHSVLGDYYRAAPDVLVMGNGYLALDADNINGSPYPDCIVAFEMPRPNGEVVRANGYVISELGKPPDFVLEIASPSTGRRDYTEKRVQYAELGVPEYWRFDSTGGDYHDAALAGDRLTPEGVYEPIQIEQTTEGLCRGYSAALGLELHWDAGKLRFWNPNTSDYVPDIADNRVGREAEAAGRRAAEAAQRAAEAAHLATADQLEAAIIDRDAYASAHQAETAAHQATQTQLDDTQAQLAAEAAARQTAEARIRQLEAQLQAQITQQQ